MIVIDLKLPPDHVDAMTCHSRIMHWLDSRNITYIKMKLGWELYPHAILIDEIDAVAFKLKFAL